MVITSRGKFDSGKRALSFIYNRLVRIYPLYWIYSFVALAAFLIHPAWWVTNAPENWRDLLVSFLLLPSRKLPLIERGLDADPSDLFLFCLCPFSLVIEGGTGPPAGLTLWALLVLAGQVYFRFGSSPSPTLDVLLHPYTLEFITGCFLGILTHRHRHSRGLIFLAGGIIAYGGSLFLLSLFPPGVVTGWNRVLHFAVPHALILYGAIMSGKAGEVISSPAVQPTGRRLLFGLSFPRPGAVRSRQPLDIFSHTRFISPCRGLDGDGRRGNSFRLAEFALRGIPFTEKNSRVGIEQPSKLGESAQRAIPRSLLRRAMSVIIS